MTYNDSSMKWVLPIQEHENGDLYITLPDNLLEETGWQENDELEWIDNLNGSWSLQRIKN